MRSERSTGAFRLAPVLAIQSTTRNAQLQRAPMQPGDTSPWVNYLRSRGAQVAIVPGVGHFTMLEAPETVNRLIAAFLNHPDIRRH